MVGLFSDDKAQAGAADLLVFALLVSISVVIMNIGPLTYQNSQQMAAFDDRYTRDYMESSILTMKYAVVGNAVSGESEVKYTIGPIGSSGFQGFIADISDVLSAVGFSDLPIDRKVKGSALDLMADDVVLNLRYDFNGNSPGGYITLSQLMAAGYTENSEESIQKTLDAVLGDKFNYFIVVEYSPGETTALKKFVYGLRGYTNFKYFKDRKGEWKGKSSSELNKYLNDNLKAVRGLKVTDIPITVSNDPDFLLELIKRGLTLLNYFWDSIGSTVQNFFSMGDEIEGNFADAGTPEFGNNVAQAGTEVGSWFDQVKTEMNSIGTLNTRAKVRIYVWTKA